jgi:hypothetical protein
LATAQEPTIITTTPTSPAVVNEVLTTTTPIPANSYRAASSIAAFSIRKSRQA